VSLYSYNIDPSEKMQGLLMVYVALVSLLYWHYELKS